MYGFYERLRIFKDECPFQVENREGGDVILYRSPNDISAVSYCRLLNVPAVVVGSL